MAYEKFYQNLGFPGAEQYIAGMAGRLNMPVDMTLRQLNLESGGNPRAKSGAGAMGVAQMMPNTWKGLQKNYPKLGLNNPWDAMQSLKAYEALMGENMRRTKGDPIKAAQAYHGGWDPKDYGEANRHYVNVVSGRETLPTGVQLGTTPQKQMGMGAAYNMGIGDDVPSVQQAAQTPGMTAPIQYQKSRDFWEEFRRKDPLQGARNYALNPITFDSLANYLN
jgi:hypothetical protein